MNNIMVGQDSCLVPLVPRLVLKFFIDFDGTITTQDVGDALFIKFGGEQCRDIVQEYYDEKISAVECFHKETTACGVVTIAELNDFLDAQTIDESFVGFVQYCKANGFELYILSDGMDYYIHRILNRYGVGDVPVYANILTLQSTDTPLNPLSRGDSSDKKLSRVRLVPSFPYTDEVCTRCASCKRNHMLNLSSDETIIAYIGEGYSDRCPVKFADVIFAKDELLKYCRREEIPHAEYSTFSDIIKYVDKMIHKNGRTKLRLKKRRLAELARREVFAGG
ncbi:MAG: 2-hydroxy-3-keto-5-methylthiopentenyl-1-phosphate phosphatase [Bacteroidetes bacterium]|nr:MAG: 2-hydroxy-3-keto-5-methylthiopentenyl-1-phosphate phosphatase [Bacteroidota bacterium]